MNWFSRLIVVFTHGDELELALRRIKWDNAEAARKAENHKLDLCKKHQQESNHSHYAEHNCSYCKLEKIVKAAAEDGFNV